MASAVLCLAAACGSGQRPAATPGTLPASITVTSPAFSQGGTLPARFTCDGAGVSPPLSWSGVPAASAELAVAVTDPDAPGGTFIHWVLLGLPPTTGGVPEGGPPPDGLRAATSAAGRAGYVPPCPPRGQTHRYHFSVFALRQPERLPQGVLGAKAIGLLDRTVLASGTLIATYGR